MQRERLTLSDTYDNDIYDIYNQDGEKRIQILGYPYIGDSIEYNSFRNLEFALSEFIEQYRADPEFVNEEEWSCKEYAEYFNSEKDLEEFLGMNNPSCPLIPLKYGDITMETPCGHYINF